MLCSSDSIRIGLRTRRGFRPPTRSPRAGPWPTGVQRSGSRRWLGWGRRPSLAVEFQSCAGHKPFLQWNQSLALRTRYPRATVWLGTAAGRSLGPSRDLWKSKNSL